jgi:hypothetical protein
MGHTINEDEIKHVHSLLTQRAPSRLTRPSGNSSVESGGDRMADVRKEKRPVLVGAIENQKPTSLLRMIAFPAPSSRESSIQTSEI